MKTCILFANCQGEAVKRLLNKYPAFLEEWEVKYYINFNKTPIPEGEIENCDLLLYQKLGEEWGDLSSDVLLSRLSQNAKSICLPNVSSFHLWPTVIAPTSISELWADPYIDDLISKKLSSSEIIYIVMRADFSKILDLPTLMRESLECEYTKDYFGRTQILDFIEHAWRKKQLFTTPNHPANELIFFITNLILKELNFRPINVHGGITDFICDNDYYLPVHPFYINYYGLTYLTEDTEYPVFGNNLTYKEYLMAYVDARKKGIPLLHYFAGLKK